MKASVWRTHLRAPHPTTESSFLSQYAEPTYVLAILERGSDRRGYLLKERIHDRASWFPPSTPSARGGSVIDPKIASSCW